MSTKMLDDVIASRPAALHFSADEFADRQRRVRDELSRRQLDGLMVTRAEDLYWLSGLETASVFHVLFIGVNGELTHLSRSADLPTIAYSSVCRDIRLVDDAHGYSRADEIKNALASHRMQGRRVGVELDSFGMLPALFAEVRSVLEGWCTLEDASDLIRGLRRVKSSQEIHYMRQAGDILAEAADAAIAVTRAGAFEGDMMAEFQRTVLSRGAETCSRGDFPLGSGAQALLVRPVTGRGRVSANDQVMFEPAVAYRHYHAAGMFTVLTGPRIDRRHLDMHAACVEALDSVQQALRPGNTFGDLYDAHASVLGAHGYEHAMLPACGYSVGAVWMNTLMEAPMIAHSEPLVIREGMTIFTHMILLDRTTGLAMALGETAVVTASEPDIITPQPRDPIIIDV